MKGIQSFIDELIANPMMLAAITYLGVQLKSLPMFVWKQFKKRFLFDVNIEETSELYSFFEVWLRENHPQKYRSVNAGLSTETMKGNDDRYDEDEGRFDDTTKKPTAIFWQFDDTFFLRYRKRRLFIQKGREQLQNASRLSSLYFNSYSISGLFSKGAILELVEEVIEFNHKKAEKRMPFIKASNGRGYFESIGRVYQKGLDGIVLDCKEELEKDISDFIAKRQWYLDRNIPYKRGYLFYGGAGNGKTSTCLAMSRDLGRDIYFINVNDFSDDKELIATFHDIRDNSITVLEDIDVAFGDRDSSNAKISMSVLFNCLDGAFSKQGNITILTTNRKEVLDPALIRKGRCDVHFLIDNPSRESVEKYVGMFYDTQVSLPSYEMDLPMVDIQNLCMENSLEEVVKNLTQKGEKRA